jgi:hypothetical protein
VLTAAPAAALAALLAAGFVVVRTPEVVVI